tara:strand:+ start:1120 stop:1917 length:798 start_codon:yes stop_codon:yes gene_type:complete
MKRSIVHIKKMDCPSESKMIESLFEREEGVKQINFDFGKREATFYHEVKCSFVLEKLSSIGLKGELKESEEVSDSEIVVEESQVEAKTLKILLGINFGMFVVEITLGIIAESTGLLADGLDMFADSLVYGVSLFAVGKSLSLKNKAAFFSGTAQVLLALFILFETVRRFITGSEPLSDFMIIVSVVALAANITCLALIHKHRKGEVHMQASWIFSANDVLANIGVLIAGVLVCFTNSNLPDLIIGAMISIIIIRGGINIIKLSKA